MERLVGAGKKSAFEEHREALPLFPFVLGKPHHPFRSTGPGTCTRLSKIWLGHLK